LGRCAPDQELITVRLVDDEAIRTHGAVRFRSEYHYAVFEYWRSAKVLRYLDRSGIAALGHVLDDGCGGGGMAVSFAEESDSVTAIDLSDRFAKAGTVLAREKGVSNIYFARTNGQSLPFVTGHFDTVFSHSVIEHVADPLAYLREMRRVLRSGGMVFLQTAPYLSPSGNHLPRFRSRFPFYLFLGRTLSFRLSCWLGAHAPSWLDAPAEGSTFITTARRGEAKLDDLLYHVTVKNLRRNFAAAGLRVVREDLDTSALGKRLFPAGLVRRLPGIPLVRDILVTNQQYILTAD
jgi:2-polyprenyl-3-methyl-5-hydroxy-6-metoxy-1,4-benzoquinol methylase